MVKLQVPDTSAGGLTLNQAGANDTNILTLKSSDIDSRSDKSR